MERLNRSLFLLLIPLLLGSCSPWKDVSVSDPQLKELQWSTEKEDTRTVDIRVLATVENPNNSSFRIVSSDLDLFLEEKKVGNAELKEKVKIPGNSREKHEFHVQAQLKDLAEGGLRSVGSVLGGNAPMLRMKGLIKGRAYGVFTKSFEVNEEKRINVSDLMGHRSTRRSTITR